ncbi:acetolactate synthase large subunit (plasmid) [Bacillus mycoides]|nr:acetolactate synthase large subunit [Bacillus mycoides]
MADTYGRITGKPGVCLSTLGPGATNLITGVANAHLDRSPIVAITGQAERNRLHKESHQNIDTIQLFNGITKYNQQISCVSTIPEIIRKAFDLATAESPGAVHLQLPADLTREEVMRSPIPVHNQAVAIPDKTFLKTAANLIKEAKRPIIFAGNGIMRSHAWEEVRLLVEKANLPLVNTFMAKGFLPFEHPLNLFAIGGRPTTEGLLPLTTSDLVITIGFDLVEYDPETWNKDKSIKILNIHSIRAETDEHFPIELDLIGDLKKTLQELTKLVIKRPDPQDHIHIREGIVGELHSIPFEEEELPRNVMWVLSEALPKESILISGVGLHKVWVSKWYQPKTPGKTIIHNGLASMGAALPGAIGCCLAAPDSTVVVVSGDGGFLMNCQELETARRLGLNFTIIIFNDQRYGLIEKHQQQANLAVTQVSFTNPDFNLLAQSFGIKHRRAINAIDFSIALDDYLKSGELSLLEVVLR